MRRSLSLPRITQSLSALSRHGRPAPDRPARPVCLAQYQDSRGLCEGPALRTSAVDKTGREVSTQSGSEKDPPAGWAPMASRTRPLVPEGRTPPADRGKYTRLARGCAGKRESLALAREGEKSPGTLTGFPPPPLSPLPPHHAAPHPPPLPHVPLPCCLRPPGAGAWWHAPGRRRVRRRNHPPRPYSVPVPRRPPCCLARRGCGPLLPGFWVHASRGHRLHPRRRLGLLRREQPRGLRPQGHIYHGRRSPGHVVCVRVQDVHGNSGHHLPRHPVRGVHGRQPRLDYVLHLRHPADPAPARLWPQRLPCALPCRDVHLRHQRVFNLPATVCERSRVLSLVR
jgi:hypothetical protein